MAAGTGASAVAQAAPPTMTGSTSALATPVAEQLSTTGPLTVFTSEVDGSGGSPLHIFDARRGTTRTISRTGEAIVGDTNGEVVAYGAGSDVFLFDPATGTTTKLATSSNGAPRPSVSASAVAWDRAGTFGVDVSVFDRTTGSSRLVPRTGEVALLPVARGGKVVYVDCSEFDCLRGSRADLRAYDVASNTSTTIFTGGLSRWDMDFDGTRAVVSTFHDRDQGDFFSASLRVVDLAGVERGRLVGFEAVLPRISGEWVVFLAAGESARPRVGLWHWTTGDVFFPSELSVRDDAGVQADIDGTRVVFPASDGGLRAFDFGLSSAVSVTNDFDACTSASDLGAFFLVNGTWYCRSGRARGESAGGLALSLTRPMTDTDVQALVQRNGSSGSGLVARAQGNSYYAARLLPSAVQLVRVNDGTVTVLAQAARTIADNTSYRLRLKVSGQSTVSLSLAISDTTLLTYSDTASNRLLSGNAGLLSGSSARTQFDDYSLTGTATGTTTLPTAFSDTFDGCASTGLSPRWIKSGAWACMTGRGVGSNTGDTALADLPLFGRTEIRAEVTVGGGSGGGLILRQNGNAFYAARVLSGGRLQIIKMQDGVIKVLSEADTGAPATGTFTMRFAIDDLERQPGVMTALFFGLQISAIDASSTPLLSGRAGLLSGGTGMGFDNVIVRGTIGDGPTPPAGGVFFADDFDACTSTNDLGPFWDAGGTWYCKAARARGESAMGVATASAATPSDVTVQARVQLNFSATGSGVVARNLGAFYAGRILQSGRAQIVRVDFDGNVTVLADVAQSIVTDRSYQVRLQVSGQSNVQLALWIDGVKVATASDSSSSRITRGGVGLLSGSDSRSQFDDFSAKSP